MKKRLFHVVLASLTLVSLASCGHATDTAKASKVAFVTTAQNQNQQVWYRLNTPAPQTNSQVRDVLVQQKGHVADYQVNGLQLTQLSHQTVSQTITLAKQNERQAYARTLARQKSNYLGQLKTDKANQKNSDQYTYKKGIKQANSQAKLDQKMAAEFSQTTGQHPFKVTKAYPVTAKVGKNKSGKQVTSEVIHLRVQKWQFGTATTGTVKQVPNRYQIRLTVQSLMPKPVKVQGTQYIGYYGSPDALVTKTSNAKAMANFDTPDIHGVN